MAASTPALQLFKQAMKLATGGRNFDRVLGKVNLVAASPGRCSWEVLVEEPEANGQRTLHGGYMMTMVDTLTLATLAREVGKIGVSVQLNMSFFRSADIGEKAGKTLGFTKADIFNSSGDIIATGSHMISLVKSRPIPGMPSDKDKS
ncbi:acyl-coenzyme A thioesterase 13-like [Patiria miniata]|uniref:Thioesterase domain-containing protein n=1 Tax=Patiria miniata TaxID=46514 RepID=A0A913ZZ04_PATMI|nr:acyl-coenzyme A thioesterase 13-like [Patiria miniata]